MKIAVLFGWQNEVFFQGDMLLPLYYEAARRKHQVYFLHTTDPIVTLSMIREFDWILYSLHGLNKHLNNFINIIPAKIKLGVFQHDYFCTTEDIAYSSARKPDVIFYDVVSWAKSTIPDLDGIKRVAIRPPKMDLYTDVAINEKANKIVLIEEYEDTDVPGAYSSIVGAADNKILTKHPLSKIAALLRENKFDVNIKGYYKMRHYDGVEVRYPGSYGAVQAMKEASFVIGSVSSMLIEAALFGAIPLVLPNRKNLTLDPISQYGIPINTVYKEPGLYYNKRQGPFALPMTWIPKLTDEIQTDPIFKKIEILNAQRPEVLFQLVSRFVHSTVPAYKVIVDTMEEING